MYNIKKECNEGKSHVHEGYSLYRQKCISTILFSSWYCLFKHFKMSHMIQTTIYTSKASHCFLILTITNHANSNILKNNHRLSENAVPMRTTGALEQMSQKIA